MSATGGGKHASGGSPWIATGGKSPTYVTGGAKTATGGSPMIATGGTKASGGKTGAGGVGGGGATTATGGTDASGGSGGAGGGTVITSCNDTFPYLGTWKGNILDFYFQPTEAVELDLYKDASGNIAGKFTWGEGAPPPAPQGADIPYPPGYWDQPLGPSSVSPDPWPGYAYTIVRGAGCDTTFRFAVSTDELWQGWCTLQTPVFTPDYGGSWGCTLRGSATCDSKACTIQPMSGASATYPLWKCEACGAFTIDSGVCACDKNGCFANTTATHTFNLAYSVSGGTQILSGPDPSCADCTVRLERQN